MDRSPVLEMLDISKSFPGVRALEMVSLAVYAGEVHVLLGENGAGKSTLMKVLTGVYPRESGSILIGGKPEEIDSPREALDLGISMVYQEPCVAAHLSVAENIFLGREPCRYKHLGVIDRKALYRDTLEILNTIGLEIHPDTPVRKLSVAYRQMVEIAKAVSANARIIILDEPTACLTDQEKQKLFEVIRALKERNVALIYISHRLEEITEIGDVITILRDGRVVAARHVSSSIDELIRLMAGREVTELFPKTSARIGGEILRVENLCQGGKLRNISFSVRSGEIIGLAGLVGSGRTELARAVFGADPFDSGQVLVGGRPVDVSSPSDAIRAGIGYLSEDRKLLSLALNMTVRANVTLAALKQYCTGPVIRHKAEYAAVENCMRTLSIKARHPDQKVKFLSGGNQQKVVVARWMVSDSKVLFFDEPATGVDVASRVEIFQLMNRLVKQGKAVVFISSYLPEILAMCDRVLVMRRGRITAELQQHEATAEKVLYYSTIGSPGKIDAAKPESRNP